MKINLQLSIISKLVVLSVLLITLLPKVYAQDVETNTELDSIALKMFKDMNNKDYESIMNMTHPDVFDIVPKESMVALMKSLLEGNEDFSVEIPDQIPEYKLSEVFNDSEHKTDYAFVSYDMSMVMTFHKQEFDDEGKEMMVKMMQLQDMDVEFLSDNKLNIVMKDRMTIILNDDSTDNNWVMINYDPNSPIFFKILSAPILTKAKDYYQELKIENKKKE